MNSDAEISVLWHSPNVWMDNFYFGVLQGYINLLLSAVIGGQKLYRVDPYGIKWLVLPKR